MNKASQQKWNSGVLLFISCASILTLIAYISYRPPNPLDSTKPVKFSTQEIPSIEEFQNLLNQIEPENAIIEDGKLGKATEQKWNKVWMNQQGIRAYESLERIK